MTSLLKVIVYVCNKGAIVGHKRVLIQGLKRFRQKPAECAVASAATLANYFDSEVTYKKVTRMMPYSEKKDGLITSQQCILLNKLGFECVTIVTADQTIIDFAWAKLRKKSLIKKIKSKRAHYGRARNKDAYVEVDYMVQWLEDDRYDNSLIIDYDWRKYITRSLNRGYPVGANFDWTTMHRFSKGSRGDRGDITGETEDHSVVIRGYDREGVYFVDPHWECYNGKRAKYRNGYYKVSWDTFLINTTGDLILIG